MLEKIDVTVVIPTRNRLESLLRSLKSLNQQHYLPFEIIVVDSSDQPLQNHDIAATISANIPFQIITTRPSVCIQRNRGIQAAKGNYIFLCDDDVEAPPDYIATIVAYFEKNPTIGAVSGLVLEKNELGKWTAQHPKASGKGLLWSFIFQLGLWGDTSTIQSRFFLIKWLKSYYQKKGNTYSLAGWPINSQFDIPILKVSVYGLGASIVKKKWLVDAPYDEILDPYGIGDNYGVSLQFPQQPCIDVLKNAYVHHHKTSVNRLPFYISYYRRVLALHYFLTTNPRFTVLNRLFLLWSLVGNWLMFLAKGKPNYRKATTKLLWKIMSGQNPYLLGKKRKAKVIVPELEL